MTDIIPTVVPTTFEELCTRIAAIRVFSSQIHIDIADGIFADNQTWMPEGEVLPEADTLFYETHLMVQDPLARGNAMLHAGVHRVIAHLESFSNVDDTKYALETWRAVGGEAGLALLIDTPLEHIEPFIPLCDVVHVMTISTIGKQGTPFEEGAYDRVRSVRNMFPHVQISVDGGVDGTRIKELIKAGANRVAVGSAIAQAADPASVYKQLSELANNV